MKSKQVIFTKPYEVIVDEVDVREPGEGEVLVESVRTLISSGTELTALTGDFPPDSVWSNYIRFPISVGYSNAGRVLKTGPGVTDFQEGDRVISALTHTQYGVLPARYLQKMPESLSFEEASYWQIGKIVLNGIRLSTLQLGEVVVILGVGLLGQVAVQLARLSGAWPVIAVDFVEKRRDLALKMGAHFARGAEGEDILEAVKTITRERMADVVLEVTGSPKAIPPALKWLRRRGRFIFLGSTRGPVEIDFHNEVHALGLVLIGAHNSTHTPYETPFNTWTHERDAQFFMELVSAGAVNVKSLTSHHYSWQDAPEAYTMLLKDRTEAMGVVLDWA